MAGADVLLPGPVTVTVSCRTARNTTKGSKRHPVTLHPDGTVETPHDLEQERILAALGGYLSCLELVDVASPAFLEWYTFEQRIAPRPIRARQAQGPWHAAKKARCCPRRGFVTPQEAGAHARDPRHVALTKGANPRQVAELARGVHEPAPETPDEPWATLWDCGMHPDEVDRITREVGAAEPLTIRFYLAVMSNDPDLQWIGETAEAIELPPHSVEWLAWTYGKHDRADLTARARWLATGVMDRLVVPLMKSAYEIEDVARFAAYWEMSFVAAALHLLTWHNSGVAPPVAELVGEPWAHLAYPPPPPKWETRARLRDAVDRADDYTEVQVAVALARAGTVGRAARVLEWGLWR